MGPSNERLRHPGHILGDRGEEAALQWYLARGWSLIDRNWHCREGELDLILRHGDMVVFCEVKSRVHERFADAAAAVDYRKQAKLRRAALRWLADQPYCQEIRFDVAVVISGRVRVIEGAF